MDQEFLLPEVDKENSFDIPDTQSIDSAVPQVVVISEKGASDDWRLPIAPLPFRQLGEDEASQLGLEDRVSIASAGPWEMINDSQMEAEDLPTNKPAKIFPTGQLVPRRVAVCYNLVDVANDSTEQRQPQARLEREGSTSSLLLTSILLVKFYDIHHHLGVFSAHDGRHLGRLKLLGLPEGAEIGDLCVSNRFQLIYITDTVHKQVHAVDLTGQCKISHVVHTASGPFGLCADDRNCLLFVCLRKKLRVFRLGSEDFLDTIKHDKFKVLSSAAVCNDRLWVVDNEGEQLHIFSVVNRGEKFQLQRSIGLVNPQCVSLDISGSAFVSSGEPEHHVTVYDALGNRVGDFGGWEAKQMSTKFPTGLCACQLSDIVDKRQLVLCCFSDNSLRIFHFKNPDTSVV